ncbi:MAG: M20/M25/M40 family metallo-hydrolase [Ktedonobacterales bacterium]|nr:M20/M25/M40 family metallo-hydrolase [Ktedonobacterales bacterium]
MTLESSDRERVMEILRDLISFPTVTGNTEQIYQCVEWVRDHAMLRNPSLRAQWYENQGSPSLLLVSGEAPPRVLFCGHLDVVEAGYENAFRATIDEQDHMQGRGAADMKGPIAAMLDLMEQTDIPGVGLLLTTDEEIGGFKGAQHLLDVFDWRPEIVILPDGGAGLQLVLEQKGFYIIHAVLERNTKVLAPVAMAEDNPIEKLYATIHQIRRMYPPIKAEDDWRPSVTISQLHGETRRNGLVMRAEATIDLRYPASYSDDNDRLLTRIIGKFAQQGIQAKAQVIAAPYFISPHSPWIQRLQASVAELGLNELPLVKEAGSSDARHFAHKHIPVLIFQPICAFWHNPDEWVDIPSLMTFRAICARFIHNVLK